MPTTSFESLPDSSRVWVYGADRPVDAAGTNKLLAATDAFLAQWKAHGVDLTSARNWGDDRFLTIAVDQEQEGASGCSIDGLFRSLKALENDIGVKLVTSGLVYFRGRDGQIKAVTRDEFSSLAAQGEVDAGSQVFDLSVTTLGEWRARFRSRAADSWHMALISERV
jgi:hypothetical protein